MDQSTGTKRLRRWRRFTFRGTGPEAGGGLNRRSVVGKLRTLLVRYTGMITIGRMALRRQVSMVSWADGAATPMLVQSGVRHADGVRTRTLFLQLEEASPCRTNPSHGEIGTRRCLTKRQETFIGAAPKELPIDHFAGNKGSGLAMTT